jgi:hypothetical protein
MFYPIYFVYMLAIVSWFLHRGKLFEYFSLFSFTHPMSRWSSFITSPLLTSEPPSIIGVWKNYVGCNQQCGFANFNLVEIKLLQSMWSNTCSNLSRGLELTTKFLIHSVKLKEYGQSKNSITFIKF